MYTSKINIKHRRSTEIHWGMHKQTNTMIWIDDVEANGYECNCKCAYCGSDLKACTQGKIQQHHFKHRGNNGCYYSDEIAEYLKAKEFLAAATSMWIPPVAVRIGDRPQIIQAATQSAIEKLHCSYDANHYPPLFIANIDTKPTRIILSFTGYYSQKDYKQLIEDARENNWNCLEIILPPKGDGLAVTKELLVEYIAGMNTNKRWIFNSKAHDCFVRLKHESKKLPPKYTKYGEITDIEFECPLHKREFNGKFYAFKNDCNECEFRLDFISDCCRCLAEAFIKTLSDIDIPENARKEHFLALQKANELAIRELHVQKAATESIGTPLSDNLVDNVNDSMPVEQQEVKEIFHKQICPYCGKRLYKHIGKYKVNWSCLTPKCDFYAIEDMGTAEIKIIHNGKEVK